MAYPEYRFLVDWDGLNALSLGSFDNGVDGWEGQSGGGTTPAPLVQRSTTRSVDGPASLLTTWFTGGGGYSLIRSPEIVTGFTVGRTYTMTSWVWVPTGSAPVKLGPSPAGFGNPSVLFDQWEQISVTWVAGAEKHYPAIWPNSGAGGQFWMDRPRITGLGGDITRRVLQREQVTLSYGRDQARSLSPAGPAQAGLLLDNRSRDYSPENTSSPLNGFVSPNRDLLVEAMYEGRTYSLFRGKTDDYEVLPHRTDRTVSITAVDAMAALRGQTISTGLHSGITTGRAVNLILDACGWPEFARDIDAGATGIQFWWEEQTDAGAALERIINSEGPPATAFVSASGNFVFRDRHHRLTRTSSLTSQATLSDVSEPAFSSPLVYDHGWRDIINSVTLTVENRTISGTLEAVWTSDSTYSISDGETLPVRALLSDPAFGAVVPAVNADYRLRSGNVTASLSATSGAGITIFLKAVGGPAVVDGLQLRAYAVASSGSTQVHAEDPASIQKYGRRSYSQDAPWVNYHDALAVAEVILAHRAERLPIVSFRVASGGAHPARTMQQLGRDLSDRVTIVDSETGLNDGFFIDRIEHTIGEGGRVLETVFGCEKAPTAPGNLMRFDVAGKGFNDGVFGAIGLDETTTMFRFDTAGQGFDQGVLAH